jgi:uncharacterized protein (DUF1015 family)
MSVFKPFKAFRPNPDLAEKVSSKPYDVLNAKEAKEESAGNPYSFYHVNKPEIDFEEGQDPFAPEVYVKGNENLLRLIEEGTLVQDTENKFYVYQIIMGGHKQTGLVGCCAIDDYFNKVIKKHELTKPHIEASRMKHIVSSEFAYEPVFFSYRKVNEIDFIVDEVKNSNPLYDFVSADGVRHTVWTIEDKTKCVLITELFENHVPVIYIADGHHRTAAGALGGRELRSKANGHQTHNYNDLLCVVFPHDQVKILDYNRVIKDLNGMEGEAFLSKLSEKFSVQKQESKYHPQKHSEIGMYLDGIWYKMEAKAGTYDANDVIDQMGFTMLSKFVLDPLLNIVDLRRDKRIDFVGGIRGLEELEKRVDSGEMKAAFAMYPISMDELFEVADNDLILPPKVTWFEPKLRSGLFVHSLSGQAKASLVQ